MPGCTVMLGRAWDSVERVWGRAPDESISSQDVGRPITYSLGHSSGTIKGMVVFEHTPPRPTVCRLG